MRKIRTAQRIADKFNNEILSIISFYKLHPRMLKTYLQTHVIYVDKMHDLNCKEKILQMLEKSMKRNDDITLFESMNTMRIQCN